MIDIKQMAIDIVIAEERARLEAKYLIEESSKLIEKPLGISVPINVTVDNIAVIDFIKDFPNRKLFSISIVNDGPDEVYVGVNSLQTTSPMKVGEAINLDYKAPRIEKIYLYSGQGKIAKVRGKGVC